MTMLLAAPALLLIAVVFGWPMLRYAWLSFHADSVLTGLEPVANGGANSVSYTHLTLPTTPYV